MKTVNLYLNRDKSVSLVREGSDYAVDNMCCASPNAIYEIAKILQHTVSAEEKLIAYYLDTKNNLIAFSEVSHGFADCSPLNVKGIMQRALLSGASSIILSHNHPSGDVKPSEADIIVTKHTQNAAELLGLRLLDHIIVAAKNYTSMKEENLI